MIFTEPKYNEISFVHLVLERSPITLVTESCFKAKVRVNLLLFCDSP